MRLDVYMAQAGIADSRSRARSLIDSGFVRVDGALVSKASFSVPEGAEVTLSEHPKYVGRGALKLEAALDAFDIDPRDRRCVDIGASTGGFTDCLLKRGAAYVCCVDSGKGQLHPSLRDDPRVRAVESFNARNLDSSVTEGKVEIAVMDVSFISQTLLYDGVMRVLSDGGIFISLIKPQFEAGRENVGKGGIVRSRAVHLSVLSDTQKKALAQGLSMQKLICSPLRGGDGNTEYLALFKKGKESKRLDFEGTVPSSLT